MTKTKRKTATNNRFLTNRVRNQSWKLESVENRVENKNEIKTIFIGFWNVCLAWNEMKGEKKTPVAN